MYLKAILVFITLFSVITQSNTDNSNFIWKIYYPLQSGLIGAEVDAYNNSTGEISIGKHHNVNVRTVKTTNQQVIVNIKNKKFALLNNAYTYRFLRLDSILIQGDAYIDKLDGFSKVPQNKRFIYQGIRAKKAKIIFSKIIGQSFKPDVVLQAAKKLGSKITDKINNITFVDTAAFNKTGTGTMVVNNPNLYLQIQIAELTPRGVSQKWRKTFNPGTANSQRDMVLYPKIGKFKSRTVEPAFSKKAVFINKSNPPKFWLEIDKDINGKLQLYITNSMNNKPILIPRNKLSNTIWSYTKHYVGAYPVSKKRFKIIKIDIEAHKTANGGIKITKSLIRYPGAKLKIIK